MALDTVRVPASDMAHLFQALAPGQLRGITWLAPILLRLHELDQYEDAALVKAKVAALSTGFIRDPDGTVAGLNTGGAVNGVLNAGMEPGSLIPPPPGADIQFSDPADPGDYTEVEDEDLDALLDELATSDRPSIVTASSSSRTIAISG
jgi:capsid protein